MSRRVDEELFSRRVEKRERDRKKRNVLRGWAFLLSFGLTGGQGPKIQEPLSIDAKIVVFVWNVFLRWKSPGTTVHAPYSDKCRLFVIPARLDFYFLLLDVISVSGTL